VPIADVNFGELLLLVFEIFLFVAWFWIFVVIISDLFRDHELSGWWKAVWVLFLIFVPFITGLIYLIVRGRGMAERSGKEQREAKREFDSYVREQAGTTPANELEQLQGLRERGALTDAEFEAAKARILA
jgi:Short C-terminal domain/Phospholipase_D-nuclease N-terminal